LFVFELQRNRGLHTVSSVGIGAKVGSSATLESLREVVGLPVVGVEYRKLILSLDLAVFV